MDATRTYDHDSDAETAFGNDTGGYTDNCPKSETHSLPTATEVKSISDCNPNHSMKSPLHSSKHCPIDSISLRRETKEFQIQRNEALQRRDELIRQAHEWYTQQLVQIEEQETLARNQILCTKTEECTLCFDAVADCILPCSHMLCVHCVKRVTCCPWDRIPFTSYQTINKH
jgi:hypothetical protein